MKATELRIGNIVSSTNEQSAYAVIDEITSKTVIGRNFPFNNSIVSWTIDSEKVEPIPLTEEWLIKFGLERKDEDYFYLKKDIREILIDVNEFDVWFDFREEGYYCAIRYDVNCVHKLQNFYFELNDTELELK